jgi:hypothetical protein
MTILKALSAGVQIDTSAIESEVTKTVKAEVSADIKRLKAELKAATMPPSIPASETSSGGEGAEKAKPGKTATARKPKLNASEAMSGIAAAMQSVEDQATTASPDAQATTIAVGSHVRVLSKDKVGAGLARYAGRDGVVAKDLGDGVFQVKLQRGGSMPMTADQIEMVEEVAA